MSGFGAGGFGSTGFGTGGAMVPAPAFTLAAVTPIAENRLRLTYTEPVYYSGIGDPQDASQISKFSVAVVAGSTGLDGAPGRDVGVIASVLSPASEVGALFGWCVDLVLDRAMSPHPVQYVVTSDGVWNATLTAVDPVSLPFVGVHMELGRPALDVPTRSRDFAFPPLSSPANDNTGLVVGSVPAAAVLATYRSNGRGDYAYDEGIVGLKKRVMRRLTTRPGGFAHLGRSYGVGVPQQLKKLATSKVVQQLATEAQKQIAEEPDVAVVRVTAMVDAAHNLVRFSILIRAVGGQAVSLSPSFRTAA